MREDQAATEGLRHTHGPGPLSGCRLLPREERAPLYSVLCVGAPGSSSTPSMPSFAGLASYACMLLVGFLVGHFELHTTVPTQLHVSQMEHKVRAKLRCTRAVLVG